MPDTPRPPAPDPRATDASQPAPPPPAKPRPAPADEPHVEAREPDEYMETPGSHRRPDGAATDVGA